MVHFPSRKSSSAGNTPLGSRNNSTIDLIPEDGIEVAQPVHPLPNPNPRRPPLAAPPSVSSSFSSGSSFSRGRASSSGASGAVSISGISGSTGSSASTLPSSVSSRGRSRSASVSKGRNRSRSASADPHKTKFSPEDVVQATQIVEGLVKKNSVCLFTKSRNPPSALLSSLLLRAGISVTTFEVDTTPDNLGPVIEYYLDERAQINHYPRPYRCFQPSHQQLHSRTHPGSSWRAGEDEMMWEPQLFVKQQYTGGLEEVMSLEEQGRLKGVCEIK